MPQPDFAWLLNPNTPLSETDTAAAESAVASGGMAGSPFAANNRLRLRDSERIARLKTGEELLQPYLNRSSAEGIAAGNQAIQRAQIAQQAASDALHESGLNSRLSSENQQRLQLALISGNQQAAHDLLSESGANTRQAAQLAAGLQERTMTNQANLLQSLLPYALGKPGAGAPTSGGAAGTRGFVPEGYQSTNYSGAAPDASSLAGMAPTPAGLNWGAPGRGGGGVGASLGPVLDGLLRSYGLQV